MEVHPRLRMSILARQVVADLLAANDAHHPVQAKRSLEQAISGALEYERMRQEHDFESTHHDRRGPAWEK